MSGAWTLILIMAGVTFLTRALPFALFPAGRSMPDAVLYLGKVLPYAVIGMLIAYCLGDVQVAAYPFGLPALIATAVTALLHWFGRKSFLSIAAGTVLYMVLIQAVFI